MAGTDEITADSLVAEEPGMIRRVREREEYSNRFVTLNFDDVVFPSGAEGRYTRITAGTGMGVVAVPYASYRGLAYLGLVRQYRYPVGEFTLEFPRGGSDDLSLAEAARELIEETGLEPVGATLLGTIRPDTGLLDTTVAVWRTTHVLKNLHSDHVEDETGATVRWYSHGEISGLVRSGKISCSITLASLALIEHSGTMHSVV